ncbi:MAG: putative endolysin [Prokaryotic dsDNA virus sp.]|nr:MAG: putative endolysin [Prokaryotic dsDNA virus sp.]|tara:strand:+ start:4867 stop:5289 length:423 start_codon:yes stop_codon:yes gene_type:complete
MRDLNRIILHCSATVRGAHYDVETLRQWHKARNFKDIGYHYVIYLDGTVHKGRPIEEQGAHTRGHNKDSVGVCYIGGIDDVSRKAKDTMTPAQDIAFIRLVRALRMVFGNLTISGHNQYTKNKACPCFDVREKYEFLLKP